MPGAGTSRIIHFFVGSWINCFPEKSDRQRSYAAKHAAPTRWENNMPKSGEYRSGISPPIGGLSASQRDGQSKGTKHMVETAQEFGLDVRVVFIGKGDCYGKTTKI